MDNIRRKLEFLTVLYTLSHKFSPVTYTYKFVMQYVRKLSLVKRSGREVDHSPLSVLKVKNAWT